MACVVWERDEKRCKKRKTGRGRGRRVMEKMEEGDRGREEMERKGEGERERAR